MTTELTNIKAPFTLTSSIPELEGKQTTNKTELSTIAKTVI